MKMRFSSAVMTLSLLLLGASLVPAHATDTDLPPRPPAPTEEIAKLQEVCAQIATEDQVEPQELLQFMLDCVNDQLTEMGYQKITELN
jgi:hypothetical protein